MVKKSTLFGYTLALIFPQQTIIKLLNRKRQQPETFDIRLEDGSAVFSAAFTGARCPGFDTRSVLEIFCLRTCTPPSQQYWQNNVNTVHNIIVDENIEP